MKKNKIIVIAAVVVIIIGGIVGWGLFQGQKLKGGVASIQQSLEPQFGLSGVVSSVDTKDNFLMVKTADSEKEIKVMISETAKLIKLEYPFDPANPPKNTTFTPEQKEVGLSDFKAGDSVFVKTKDNIAGKTKIDNVDFIHILP